MIPYKVSDPTKAERTGISTPLRRRSLVCGCPGPAWRVRLQRGLYTPLGGGGACRVRSCPLPTFRQQLLHGDLVASDREDPAAAHGRATCSPRRSGRRRRRRRPADASSACSAAAAAAAPSAVRLGHPRELLHGGRGASPPRGEREGRTEGEREPPPPPKEPPLLP